MVNAQADQLAIFRKAIEEAPLGVYHQSQSRYTMIPASLDPLVMADHRWQALQNDAHLILSALQKLGALSKKDQQNSLLQQLAPLEKERADFGGLATARLDLFFDGDEPLVIEVNTTIPAMQAYSDMIKYAYLKAFRPTATLKSSNTQDLLQSLLQHYIRTGGRAQVPRLAIVARDGDSQLAELHWLQREWQNQGYETLLVTPEELTLKNEQLWAHSQAIDLCYRHIFAHRLEQNSAFASACLRSESLRVFNPIAAHLEVKAMLAELSRYAADPRLSQSLGLNDEEIKATLRRLVWSRILHKGPSSAPDGSALPDLVSWVKEHPQDLVVKSSLGYGGHGIFIGNSFTEKSGQDRAQKLLGVSQEVKWSQLIDFLLTQRASQWIVQRKVSGRKVRHRYLKDGQLIERESYIDCSIFTNSGIEFRAGGGACRFSDDAIVNIGQGGGLMPLLLEGELQ